MFLLTYKRNYVCCITINGPFYIIDFPQTGSHIAKLIFHLVAASYSHTNSDWDVSKALLAMSHLWFGEGHASCCHAWY